MKRASQGFTLVEVVITAGVAVMVLTALYLLLESNVTLYDRGEARADVQQGARVVLDEMAANLRSAGNGVPRGTAPGSPEAIYIYYNGITVGGEPLVTSASAVTFLGDLDGTAAELTTTVSTAGTSVGIAPAARDYSVSLTGAANTVVVAGQGTWAFGQYTGPGGSQTSLPVAALRTPSGASASFSPGGGVAALEMVKYSLQGTNLVRRTGLYGGQTSATNPSITWGAAETLLDNVTGLTFTYYDANNAVVASAGMPGDQGTIRRIRITLRAQAGKGLADYVYSVDVRPRSL
jgi:Tfp pilus assembly protein PilV